MDINTAVIISLLTLTAMELVLGIDNIIFIALLVDKLPENVRDKARNIGIGLALVMRLLLLFSISWVMGLTEPLFTLTSSMLPIINSVSPSFESWSVSGRDLILLVGGIFLIYKSTIEIHDRVSHDEESSSKVSTKKNTFMGILTQIILLDIVFSLDSVITAVGMADQIWVMVVAMVVAVLVMLFSAKSISEFIAKNPSLKVLALSFLLMIGVMLVMEGCGQHVNKAYIYFAIFFSCCVEFVNMKARKKAKSH